MKYKYHLSVGLLFLFVLSLTAAFNLAVVAGDRPLNPVMMAGDCCQMPGEPDVWGVWVPDDVGPGHCSCDCLESIWPTCGGPNNCQMDCMDHGTGS